MTPSSFFIICPTFPLLVFGTQHIDRCIISIAIRRLDSSPFLFRDAGSDAAAASAAPNVYISRISSICGSTVHTYYRVQLIQCSALPCLCLCHRARATMSCSSLSPHLISSMLAQKNCVCDHRRSLLSLHIQASALSPSLVCRVL